jgi:hypothetical protein
MAERADGTLDLERDEEQERDPSRADVTPRERPAYAREDAEPRRRGTEREGDGGEHGEEQKRTRWPLIALAIVIIVGAIGAVTYWYLTKDQESTDDAYSSTLSARRNARARSDLPRSPRSWHRPSDQRSAAGSPTITVGPGSSSSMCRLGC